MALIVLALATARRIMRRVTSTVKLNFQNREREEGSCVVNGVTHDPIPWLKLYGVVGMLAKYDVT